MIEHIQESEFDEKIAQGYVLVDFTAPWCPDCRFIDPMLENLGEEFAGKIRFYKVSFDTATTLKDKLNIRKIPTLIFYKDGNEIGERLIEPHSAQLIKNALDKLIAEG